MHVRLSTVLAAVLALSAPALAQTDLSVTTITQPVSGCALASTENVTIKVFNFGSTLPAGTSFNVSYTVNAGGPVTELVTLASSLLSNSTFTYTFTTQANLSTPGSYTFAATVSIAGDVSPANDGITGVIATNTAPSVGGTVAGGTNVCISFNSGILTLSGQTGNVVRWEYSLDGGSNWVPLANTATTEPFGAVTVPTLYRALVQNGSCAPAYSSAALVTPDPESVGGTVSGSATVCPGSNAGALTLAGRTGNVLRWEFSTNGGGTWSNIANTTASQPYLNLAQTTLYRALVQSGTCASQYSAPATITVALPSAAITAPADVCPGAAGNAASVPDAGPGAIYAWGIANGTITSGAGTRAIAFTADGPGSVSLTASVQIPAGCTGNGSLAVALRMPAASIQAPASACTGASGLTASVEPDQGAGAIYFWTISNGLITGGLGTRTITFRPVGSGDVALEALVAQASCLQDTLKTVPVAPCASSGLFHPLPPCRAVDTRGAIGALGGPTLAAGETRVLPLALSSCGVSAKSAAAVLNVTTIAAAPGGLAIGAGDQPAPAIDSIPLAAGRTRGVQTIARLASDGTGTIAVRNDSAGPVDLVLFVTGTFE